MNLRNTIRKKITAFIDRKKITAFIDRKKITDIMILR